MIVCIVKCQVSNLGTAFSKFYVTCVNVLYHFACQLSHGVPLLNRGQAEKEFKVEVDAIGRVRHKNLVRLYGYCVEGTYRYD